MPFINGRFYINPAYGRALERARRADGVWSEKFPEIAEPSVREQDFWNDGSHSDAQQQSSDSHWVTIGGHHVLIEKNEGNQKSPSRRTSTEAARDSRQDRRNGKYAGSTDWAYAKQTGNFPPNTKKCNEFVYDVTKEAGAEASVTGNDGKQRPPLASEWADRNAKITNWRPLANNEKPQSGDVAAYKLAGGRTSFSGHSGIVTSVDPNGYVHGMAAHDDIVGSDDKFNSKRDRPVTYRRYNQEVDGVHFASELYRDGVTGQRTDHGPPHYGFLPRSKRTSTQKTDCDCR